MNDIRRLIDIDTFFWGLAFAAIGLLFLLQSFETVTLDSLLRNYWPLFILFLARRTE